MTIDDLIKVATGGEPPFAAWAAFLETAEGRRMSKDERDALAAIWWREGEPTLEAYRVLLAGLRLGVHRRAS